MEKMKKRIFAVAFPLVIALCAVFAVSALRSSCDVDGNGKVDMEDYISLRLSESGKYALSKTSSVYADVDGSGRVDKNDCDFIREYLLGKKSNVYGSYSLPCQDVRSYTVSTIGKSAYDSFFNNSLFVGHSITLHFKNYVDYMRSSYPTFLGNAEFFTSGSFSAYHDSLAVSEVSGKKSLHPYYNGVKMTCADAVAASGCTTVYIQGMSLNELGLNGVDGTYKYTVKLFDSIKAKCPKVRIVFLSNTYLVGDFNEKYTSKNYKLTNANIKKLNNMILDYCNTNGIDFIDVTSCTSKNGVLEDKYCIDNGDGGCGCHINRTAYCSWMAVLRNYAYLRHNGIYKNPPKFD